jgi:type II restriction/modification system DNA methylase subunit YeeA
MSLRALLDMEKEVIKAPVFAGLTDDEPLPGVHPVQLYGIEINPIAHALASIVVWIGYIQWRFENGYWQFTEPYLTRLQDNIRCMDAILAFDESGNPIEPTWPKVDVIIGNPPFLGDKKMRSELGNNYVDTLRKLYGERIPGQSDLVCYWFEKARLQIELKHCKRAGLLATNSIRGGANREVLKRIKDSGDIFMAWADREWVLDGAAVRVSMVGFDDGKEGEKMLDGIPSMSINSDLTATTDITQARNLEENEKLSFIGTQKGGPFELNAEVAMKLIASKNIKNISNEIVVKPWVNGWDITNRNRNLWIIDFGVMPLDEAQEFQAPLDYVIEHIKPDRLANSDKFSQENWWLFQRTRPEMKDAIAGKDRFICTPRVAKHRVFVWLDANVIPDSATVAIARDDDYFFGVLHSRLHEVWSLRMGTWLGKGNDPRYTPTTTFETFPFPWSPGKEPVESPEYQAIAEAARALHTEREAWLNPPEILEKSDTKLRDKLLKDRTLTNLYNALQAFRGTAEKPVKIKPVAGNFASRLHQLHTALDEAVCRAYGWPLEILNDEEAILRHLLALNLERAGA